MWCWRCESPSGLHHALATEDFLLDQPEMEASLLLWRGSPGVVLGKNQNPWRECRPGQLRELGIPLARRVSGGGAVYQDAGVLNLCWILPRSRYHAETLQALLLRALAQWGLQARSGPGGALFLEGAKIAGSAYCHRAHAVLHHTSLLIHADLDRLRGLLSPRRLRLRTHAVSSRPASVRNLGPAAPGLDLTSLAQALGQAAGRELGEVQFKEFSANAQMEILRRAEKMRSPEWIWGQTPAFTVPLSIADQESLTLEVRRGRVVAAKRGDAETRPDSPPGFPSGRFDVLESDLGLSQGALPAALRDAGWEEGEPHFAESLESPPLR